MTTTTTATTTTAPRCVALNYCPEVGAYFACLASYNNGRLHGAWVDLELCQDREDLVEAITWILHTSPTPMAEEWAMHDHAGLPDFLSRTEWPELAHLVEWAQALDSLSEAGEDAGEAYRLFCENQSTIVEPEDFESAYLGRHDSGADYAADRAAELGLLDHLVWPFNYIDWEGAWDELDSDGFWQKRSSSGGVHIFAE